MAPQLGRIYWESCVTDHLGMDRFSFFEASTDHLRRVYLIYMVLRAAFEEEASRENRETELLNRAWDCPTAECQQRLPLGLLIQHLDSCEHLDEKNPEVNCPRRGCQACVQLSLPGGMLPPNSTSDLSQYSTDLPEKADPIGGHFVRSRPRRDTNETNNCAIEPSSALSSRIEATLGTIQAWDLDDFFETVEWGVSDNAMHYHQGFPVESNSFGLDDRMDIDSKYPPLRVPQQPFDSRSTQSPPSAVTGSNFGMWDHSGLEGCGDIFPGAMHQNMIPPGFEPPSDMGFDCGFPSGQASSYPEQPLGNMAYNGTATLGYSQLPAIGTSYDINAGWVMPYNMESTMLDPSPVSSGSGSRVSCGGDFSPLSPLSMPGSQQGLPRSASSGSPLSGISSGTEDHHFGSSNMQTVSRGPAGAAQPGLQHCATHEAAASRGGQAGAKQQQQQARHGNSGNSSIRCPICGWAPQPAPSRTDDKIRQSVKKHEQRKHSGVIHRCPVRGCDTTFTRGDNVKPHVVREHPEFGWSPRRASGGGSGGKKRSPVAGRGYSGELTSSSG